MTNRLLGIIGAVLLIIGLFCPIVSVFGINISYFEGIRMNSGSADGMILAGLGIISLIVALINKTRILIGTGLLALGVLAIDFFNFKSKMSQASSTSAELSTTLANVIQLQWGWAVLVLGALLLIAAGLLKKPARTAAAYGAPPPPPGYPPGPGQPPQPPYNR